MSFLDDEYDVPSSGGQYFRPAMGDNRIRIMSDALTGYEYWNTDNKPIRSHEEPAIDEMINPKRNKDGVIQPAKHFWAMVIWDYKDNQVKVWEATQATIQKKILTLFRTEEWGNPQQYDLTITRSGEGLDTEYEVVAMPKKDILTSQADAFAQANVNLEALITGDNPFGEKVDLNKINV